MWFAGRDVVGVGGVVGVEECRVRRHRGFVRDLPAIHVQNCMRVQLTLRALLDERAGIIGGERARLMARLSASEPARQSVAVSVEAPNDDAAQLDQSE